MNLPEAKASLARLSLKEFQIVGEKRRLGKITRELSSQKRQTEISFKEELQRFSSAKCKAEKMAERGSPRMKLENLKSQLPKLRDLKTKCTLIQNDLGALSAKLSTARRDLNLSQLNSKLIYEKKLPIAQRILRQKEEGSNELVVEGAILSRRFSGAANETSREGAISELPLRSVIFEDAPARTELSSSLQGRFPNDETQANREVLTWKNLNGSGVEFTHTLGNGRKVQLTISTNLVQALKVSLMVLGRERHINQDRFAVVRALKSAGLQNFRVTSLAPGGGGR